MYCPLSKGERPVFCSCHLCRGLYRYILQLMALERCTLAARPPHTASSSDSPQRKCMERSPPQPPRPDVRSLRHQRIERRVQNRLRPFSHPCFNLPEPAVSDGTSGGIRKVPGIEEYPRYRIIGPFQPDSALHINRVGVIPKGHMPGKWRMIINLSHPPATSVNDGIDWELCTLSYMCMS